MFFHFIPDAHKRSQLSFNPQEKAKYYVAQIKEAHNFDHARDLYDAAHQEFPKNIFIINIFITQAGRFHEFSAAQAAFNEAKENKLADVVTYNSFINAAGKNGQFHEAKKAFGEAKKTGWANAVSSRGGSESYHPNFFQSIPPAKNTDNPPLQRVRLKP